MPGAALRQRLRDRASRHSLDGRPTGTMPLHHAVLALLADKPAHGYELRSSFEQAVGDQWGGLNIGHLYQIIDRLSRDALIESERQPQPVKPDRVVHHLTPAGRAELDRWLSEPSSRLRGYRDDFFLKLMAAVHVACRPRPESVRASLPAARLGRCARRPASDRRAPAQSPRRVPPRQSRR